MDDRHIRAALEQIAQQEIPDTMNLWDTLKREIPTHRAGRVTRSISLVVVSLLMLIAAAAVYAVVRWQNTDPGIQGAAEANLLTEINQSQTIDGVMLTLEWAYIDAQRFAMGYRVFSPEAPIGTQYLSNIRVGDTANSFTLAHGGGSGGGGGIGRESDYLETFGVQFVDPPPETLTMNIEITLIPQPPVEPQSGMGGGAGGGGGGGGGSGSGGGSSVEVTPEPGIVIERVPNSPDAVGVFTFTFELPYLPEVTFEPDLSTESNGITMRLESLIAAPSTTRALICYDAPDDRFWSPQFLLTVGDALVPMTSFASAENAGEGETCGWLVFYAPYGYEETTFEFTNTRLMTSFEPTPERAEQFRALLAEQGITVEIMLTESGFNYNVIGVPPEGTGFAISQAWDAVFSEFIEGDWRLTYTAPAQR